MAVQNYKNKQAKFLAEALMHNAYGRVVGGVIHKTFPKWCGTGWKFETPCGETIGDRNPYRISATQWKFVTCPKCLEKQPKPRVRNSQ